MDQPVLAELVRAARALDEAEALLIGAGAGMGVDSGLPDFRGTEGFWQAYPPYAHLGLNFYELATPRWFEEDPPLAWGFYGHRMNLYRATRPHEGFATLLRWAGTMARGFGVFTSNVDGQFQRAGFDPERVVECHGTVDWMQCTAECGVRIFPSGPDAVVIDESTMRAAPPLPACPRCGALARPNILMFGDFGWAPARSDAQGVRLGRWAKSLPEGTRLVVVELGAGTAVPSVRRTCETLTRQLGGTLIRINPREPEVPTGQVSLPLGALDALRAIDALRGNTASGSS